MRMPASIARSAIPKKVLSAGPPCLLSEFSDRVGRAMFGPDWPANAINLLTADLVAPSVGSPADMAQSAKQQVLQLLEEGVIEAVMSFNVISLTDLHSAYDEDGDPTLDDDPNRGLPKKLFFKLSETFWQTESSFRKIDFRSSSGQVDLGWLYTCVEGIAYPAERCVLESKISEIYIKDQNNAFQRTIDIGSVPARFKESLQSRRVARIVLIAAAWRWIAFKNGRVSGADIQRYITHYAKRENLGPLSEDFFRGLAYNISGQNGSDPGETSVWVTSGKASKSRNSA